MVRQQHGDGAAAFVGGRIAALEKVGDGEGADTWAAIIERLGELEAGQIGTLE
jgi:hypothetical protein